MYWINFYRYHVLPNSGQELVVAVPICGVACIACIDFQRTSSGLQNEVYASLLYPWGQLSQQERNKGRVSWVSLVYLFTLLPIWSIEPMGGGGCSGLQEVVYSYKAAYNFIACSRSVKPTRRGVSSVS